jgi:hypothetical protein
MKLGLQIFGVAASVAILLWLAATRPAMVGNVTFLGGLLILEAVFASVWFYDKWFFLIVMLAFLWAGSNLPMASAGSAARWAFLTVGALVGVAKWGARREQQRFSAIHLVALLCIVAAVATAMVSTKAQLSLLKSASLFLVFLYASCGSRITIANREEIFFRGLVTACEVISFVAGFCYVVLGFQVFGNPNSLGAVMGVAIVPVLSWGLLISNDRTERQRRVLALCVAIYLLLTSVSRAGLLASAITLGVVCLALGRSKLLVQGSLVIAFLIAVLGVLQPAKVDSLVDSFTEQVIYKGKMEQGILGSRRTPWQDTVAVMKESPWFGSGFGTDRVYSSIVSDSVLRTTEGSGREHGSSYMALLQYVGLLGIIPFAILLLLVVANVVRACLWMRRTHNPQNYAVPLAMICLAGLIHAVFEDWMFAAGYYLTLFFWTAAFVMPDFLPRRTAQPAFVGSAVPTAAAIDSRPAVFAKEDALIH